MINFAVKYPDVNATSIVNESPATLGVGAASNPWMKGFGISVPAALIAVPARVLPAPGIFYAGNKPGNVKEASWNMANIKVCQGGVLDAWLPIFLRIGNAGPPFDNTVGHEKIQILAASLAKVGIDVRRQGEVALKNLPPLEHEQFDRALRDIFEEFVKRQFKYVFFFLPYRSDTAYKRIKYFADVVYGVQCTCMLSANLANKTGFQLEQYFANVGLKVNVKLGGRNQGMSPANMGIIGQDKTMAVGIDVTHPSPGSADKAPSVASMVANIDRHCSQYLAALRVQPKRKDEMVADLDEMLQSRLKLWLSKGGHRDYPENILVFRDGVSEGQYHLVLQLELPLLREACEKLYKPRKQAMPRFFVAICGKRHHTRFYPTKIENADLGSNCRPGTVVDRGVTEAVSWEFFLQAHKCLQGTARSAHFFIILDEVFSNKGVVASLKKPNYSIADIVEEMCHNMAYLYPRATKAVSLCPPAKLADMACERARHYLQGYYDPDPSQTASQASGATQNALTDQTNLIKVHDNLKDTMFYV